MQNSAIGAAMVKALPIVKTSFFKNEI